MVLKCQNVFALNELLGSPKFILLFLLLVLTSLKSHVHHNLCIWWCNCILLRKFLNIGSQNLFLIWLKISPFQSRWTSQCFYFSIIHSTDQIIGLCLLLTPNRLSLAQIVSIIRNQYSWILRDLFIKISYQKCFGFVLELNLWVILHHCWKIFLIC